MAEELRAIPFSALPQADDGYTVLYENDQVCRSEKKLSELVGDKTSSFLTKEQGDSLYQEKGDYLVNDDITGKLDTTAFSAVSGNFLTAHQSLDEYATQEWVNNQGFLKEHQPISANEWNDVYETVVTNSGTWGTETDWSDDISAASAYAYEQAVAQIPPPFDPTFLSGEIDKKMDKTFSSNFYPMNDNPSGFITGVDLTPYQTVSGMTAYQPAGDYATTNYVNEEIGKIGSYVTATLVSGEPDVQNPSNKKIYLTKDDTVTGTDLYKEWIYTESSAWECIGDTSMDLSDYATTSQLETVSSEIVDKIPNVYIVTPTTTQKEVADNSGKTLLYQDENNNTFPLTNTTVGTNYTTYEFKGFVGSGNEIKSYSANVNPTSTSNISVTSNKSSYINGGYDDSSEQPITFGIQTVVSPSTQQYINKLIINAKDEDFYICAWAYSVLPGNHYYYFSGLSGALIINGNPYTNWEYEETSGYYYIKYNINSPTTIEYNFMYPLFFKSENFGDLTDVVWYSFDGITNYPEYNNNILLRRDKFTNFNIDTLINAPAELTVHKSNYDDGIDPPVSLGTITTPSAGTIPLTSDYYGTTAENIYWTLYANYSPIEDSEISMTYYFENKNTGDVLTDGDNLVGLKIGDTNYTIPDSPEIGTIMLD